MAEFGARNLAKEWNMRQNDAQSSNFRPRRMTACPALCPPAYSTTTPNRSDRTSTICPNPHRRLGADYHCSFCLHPYPRHPERPLRCPPEGSTR